MLKAYFDEATVRSAVHPEQFMAELAAAEAENRVTGPALDFCLLVTQRRHRDDLALAIDGQAAAEWMAIAQAFAGAAGPGRPPRRPADD